MEWKSDPVDYFFMALVVLGGLACYRLGSHGSAFALWVLAICTTIQTNNNRMMMEHTFLASALIKRLYMLINRHGDLPVIVDDPDTGWRMELGIVYRPANIKEEYPEWFEIKTSYYKVPEGNVDNI